MNILIFNLEIKKKNLALYKKKKALIAIFKV